MCINAYSYTALQNSHVRLLLRLVSMHMVCWHGKEDPRPPLGDHLKQDSLRKATKVFHRCVEKQQKRKHSSLGKFRQQNYQHRGAAEG